MRCLAPCLGLAAALACEPASSRCGDGAPEVGVFCFPARKAVRVGHGFDPEAMVVLDLDGDGALDLAAVSPARQTLSVSWGGPDGSFVRLTSWPIDGRVAGLAHGDLDGDGDVDLATALPDADAVAVLEHREGREFVVRRYATGATPRGIVALDLDGGAAELVTANLGDGSLSVLRRGIADPPTVVGSAPYGLAAGDVDGDGALDLAVTLRELDAVQVMRNVGGVLVPGARHEVGAVPGAIVAGDLDADGKLDLATADELGDTVSVVFGDGAGGARETERWPVMRQPGGLAIVRGGGIPPVLGVLSPETSELLRLDPRNGSTTPSGPTGVASAIAAGDLDRDGREEIVYGAREEGIVGSLVPGEGVRLDSLWRAPAVHTLVALDVGGDGSEELAVVDEKGDLAIWRGPDDFLTAEPIASGFSSIVRLVAGDLDGDGLDDLVVFGSGEEEVPLAVVTLLQREGGFEPGGASTAIAGTIIRVMLGDVAGDGTLDVVATIRDDAYEERGLFWLPNDGFGSLGAPVALGDWPVDELERIDLDGDAALDLVTSQLGQPNVLMFEDLGPGREPREVMLEDDVYGMAAGDLDGDGTDDLLICGRDGLMRLAAPTGDPAAMTRLAEERCFDATLHDLDGDGDLDVLSRPFDDSWNTRLRLSMLRNDGAGVVTAIGHAIVAGYIADFTTLAGDPSGLRLSIDAADRTEVLAISIGAALVETPRAELGARLGVRFDDLDGDGQHDWWGATRTELAVAFGHDGGVGPMQHVPVAGLLEPDVTDLLAVVSADLDGDDAGEIVTLGEVDLPGVPLRSLEVVRVEPPGVFRGELITRIAGTATGLRVSDLDGDRHADILVSEASEEGIQLTRLRGRGDGSFEGAVSQQLALPAVYYSVSLSELDGDDRLDLVILTADGVHVARGQDGGDFDAPRMLWRSGGGYQSMIFGDFNADRRTDLVTAGSTGLMLLRGRGNGTFAAPRRLLSVFTFSLAAGDLDGDGVDELLTTSVSSGIGSLAIGRNLGDGNFVFRSRSIGPIANSISPGISVLDLDGDGAQEIVLQDPDGLTIRRQTP